MRKSDMEEEADHKGGASRIGCQLQAHGHQG
jgi:hypothetical protein